MTTELIAHMLDCLKTPSRELTKWEEGFVESVDEQFTKRGSLSEKQIAVLERIYAEKTA